MLMRQTRVESMMRPVKRELRKIGIEARLEDVIEYEKSNFFKRMLFVSEVGKPDYSYEYHLEGAPFDTKLYITLHRNIFLPYYIEIKFPFHKKTSSVCSKGMFKTSWVSEDEYFSKKLNSIKFPQIKYTHIHSPIIIKIKQPYEFFSDGETGFFIVNSGFEGLMNIRMRPKPARFLKIPDLIISEF